MDMKTTQVHIDNLKRIATDINDCPNSMVVSFIVAAAERLRILQDRLLAAEESAKSFKAIASGMSDDFSRIAKAIGDNDGDDFGVTFSLLTALMARLASSEAKIEAAEKQEPIEVCNLAGDIHAMIMAKEMGDYPTFDDIYSMFGHSELYALPPMPAAEPKRQGGIPDEWRLISAGQINVGDWLSFELGGKRMCVSAKEVLNRGTIREEIIYNRKKNFYFITSMVLDGTSSHKNVFIVSAADGKE